VLAIRALPQPAPRDFSGGSPAAPHLLDIFAAHSTAARPATPARNPVSVPQTTSLVLRNVDHVQSQASVAFRLPPPKQQRPGHAWRGGRKAD